MVSYRIASILSEASRNLDMYLLVDNFSQLLWGRFLYLCFRNIFRNFLQDILFKTTVYGVWCSVFAQPAVEITDNIVSLRSNAHCRCPSRQPLLTSASMRSSYHNYRVLGDLSRIWLSESRILTRYPTTHSARASIHINLGFSEVVVYIFTISANCSPRPPIALFALVN